MRSVLLHRILRYVSFHPWGSLRANANRSTSHLDEMISHIWQPYPLNPPLKPFSAGAGVQWTPVFVRDGLIKFFSPENAKLADLSTVAWLASRQPPYGETLKILGRRNPLFNDVTQHLISALEQGKTSWETMYDCRFSVHFNLQAMPDDVKKQILDSKDNRILLYPNTRWLYPKVFIRPGLFTLPKDGIVLHSKVEVPKSPLPLPEPIEGIPSPKNPVITSSWITVKWVRLITGL